MVKQEQIKTRHLCCGTKEILPLKKRAKGARIAIQTVKLKTEKTGVELTATLSSR